MELKAFTALWPVGIYFSLNEKYCQITTLGNWLRHLPTIKQYELL